MRQASYKSNAKTTPPPVTVATQPPGDPAPRRAGSSVDMRRLRWDEEKGKAQWERETSGNIVWRNWWAAQDSNL